MPEDIKILLFVRGARQQNFEGLLWGHKVQQSMSTSRTGLEAQARAHNRIWRKREIMAALKSRREQLCPRLAKAEVREELLTDKCNLPKPPKEKDKYDR